MLLKKTITLLLLIASLQTWATTQITGNINYNSQWEPKIYLSLINSFDDLNTMSYDFLIAETEIDSSGYFSFDNLELPLGDRIYRLHICKKGDPVSTIIIGGKEENFIHFVTQDGMDITIKPLGKKVLIKTASIAGHNANNSLQSLEKIKEILLSPPALPSAQNRKMIQQKALKSFKEIADTSTHGIIQLLALYYIADYFGFTNNLKFLTNKSKQISELDSANPYYLSFKDVLEFIKYQTKEINSVKNSWLLILIALLVVVFGLYFIFGKSKPSNDEKNDLEKTLSIQERKVLDLLKQGKSNKEIADELHIEVSTVKSHLNKIYQRLGVKSRKEIVA